MDRVGTPGRVLFAGGDQSLYRVLADRLEYREARLGFAGDRHDETAVDERCEPVDDLNGGCTGFPGNPHGSAEGESTDEHPEPAEENLFGGCKQVVAPRYRVPHRALTGGCVTVTTRQ